MIYRRWWFVVFPQFKTRVFGKDVLLNKYYYVEMKKSAGCLGFFWGGINVNYTLLLLVCGDYKNKTCAPKNHEKNRGFGPPKNQVMTTYHKKPLKHVGFGGAHGISMMKKPSKSTTPHLSKIRQKTNFTPQLFSASAVEKGPEVISMYGIL